MHEVPKLESESSAKLENLESVDNSSSSIQGGSLVPFDVSTPEQKDRDKKITELIGEYIRNYHNKVEQAPTFREELKNTCLFVICLLALSIFFISLYVFLNTGKGSQFGNIATCVTAIISFISSILGILTIITKFYFPTNEDKFVIELVKATQENDLKNKQMLCELQSKH